MLRGGWKPPRLESQRKALCKTSPKPPSASAACRTDRSAGRRPPPCRTACERAPARRLREGSSCARRSNRGSWSGNRAPSGRRAPCAARASRTPCSTSPRRARQETRNRSHVAQLPLEDFNGRGSKRNAVFSAGFHPARRDRPDLRREVDFIPLSADRFARSRPVRIVKASARAATPSWSLSAP